MARRWSRWGALLLLLGALTLAAGVWQAGLLPWPTSPTPATDRRQEPLVPTPTPEGSTLVPPAATRTPLPPLVVPRAQNLRKETWRGAYRWGVGVPPHTFARITAVSDPSVLRAGWYVNWTADPEATPIHGATFVPIVWIGAQELQPPPEEIARLARTHPGALWLIGNEPDVRWQDNVTPADYARFYHRAYLTLKAADPTAWVAIGGVGQPSPLRLRYIEAILDEHRRQFGVEMPVDVWNIHAFILREERGSWGLDIPPGFEDAAGELYEIQDNDNLALLAHQVITFRRWMAEHGYRERPLIISEYGVVMPEEYGFDVARVAAFLEGSFDFFLTATDAELGYPTDGNRLVQAWCWFSLGDDLYPTGNLFDPATGQLTPLGERWLRYLEERW